MQALKVGDGLMLVFTKVVDELSRGLVDEDEDAEAAPTDRAYWEKRRSKQIVQLADQLLSMARKFDSSIELKYNTSYIGLSRDGQPFNFVVFRPRKNSLNVELKLPRDAAVDRRFEEAGLTSLNIHSQYSHSLNHAHLTSNSFSTGTRHVSASHKW
jgi:hypothetical protein